MNIVVFEDQLVEQLRPITLSRPAFAMTCASFRLIDWLGELGLPIQSVVRPHLNELTRLNFAEFNVTLETTQRQVLLVNARLVPARSTFQVLQKLIKEATPGIVKTSDVTAAVVLPADAPSPPVDLRVEQVDDYFKYAGAGSLAELDVELPLLEYPHDLVRWNLEAFAENLEHRLASGVYKEVADGVFAAEGATLGDYVVTDTSDGPVVLDENATIGPYCYFNGPAYLGPGARVIEHSAIKDAVSIGQTTKIGGEVEASIIEPYTNKQHHGFLGHSYLGSWINLGSGTCNSDLKNTYGNVKVECRGHKIDTGMQFVGCVIGDYAKTAINTSIFTGKSIGACSMVYGFATTNVPSFVNYARTFGQVSELTAEVMVATQKRMFQRRQVEQRPCDIQLLHDMYELTRRERQLADEPLSL